MHLLDRDDGSLVGRLATDGSAGDGAARGVGRQRRLAERQRRRCYARRPRPAQRDVPRGAPVR